MSGTVFLAGPLEDEALRATILGMPVAGRPAVLRDHRLVAAGARVGLCPEAGGQVEGLILALPPDAMARLRFHQTVAGLRALSVAAEGTAAEAFALDEGGPFDPAGWRTTWGAVVRATAQDVMALFGEVPAQRAARRYGLMLVHGASRVRAAALDAAAPGVTVARRRQVYANFFAVEEYDLSYRRFDGSMSPTVNRAVFLSGDAVTVLPYDPARDRVLLVEQFRMGPFGRGDPAPWLLEPIAGRVDPGETPPETALREAVEEAGLALGALHEVAGYYPTPAAKAEFLYSFVAIADLPDGIEGVFGVEGEAEDIRGRLVGFDGLIDMVASGRITNGPLILSALWLQRERARLRAESR